MGSLNNVPEGATLIERHEALLTNGIVTRLEYKRAYVSDGWKSDYTRHEARFIIVARRQENGKWKSDARRFSGARLDKADRLWKEWVEVFHAHTVRESTDAKTEVSR
jgi:hypothetical protein